MVVDRLVKRSGSYDLQRISGAEENYLAWQVANNLFSSVAGEAGVLSGSSTNGTSVGTHTNTFYNQPVGTHPSTSLTTSSTVTTLYQNFSGNAIEANLYPVINENSSIDFKAVNDAELNTIADRLLAKVFGSDYFSYKIGSSAPVGYTLFVSSIFTDTRTDGTSVAYNLYKKNLSAMPTVVRPLKLDGADFRTMTDTEIRNLFAQRVKNRIVQNGIGSYQLRTSIQGAPIAAGTWVAMGTALDTRQNTADDNYTRISTRDSTLISTRGSTNNFLRTSQTPFTSNFLGNFLGNYLADVDFSADYTGNYASGPTNIAGDYTIDSTINSTRTSEVNYTRTSNTDFTRISNVIFTRDTQINYTRISEVNYTRDSTVIFNTPDNIDFTRVSTIDGFANFTGNYVAGEIYTRTSTAVFARDPTFASFTGNFVGNYAGPIPYQGNFIGDYTGGFVGDYIGNFVGNYTADYGGNYIADYAGDYIGGNFLGDYIGNYVGNYVADDYVGNYIGNYISIVDYTRDTITDFVGDFVADYIGNYEGGFEGDYLGNFIGDYTGDYAGETIQSTSSTIEIYTLYLRTA